MKKKPFAAVRYLWCFCLSLAISTTWAQNPNARNAVTEELIDLQGQITDFSFRSPASSISLLVSDASGISNWTIEAPSAGELRRLGWNSSSLFTGEIVNLRARHIGGLSQQAELVSLIRANGGLLLASAQTDSGQLDLSAIPSGLYRLDSDHAYMTFSYDHQSFSRPQLRFDRFSASLNFDAENPETSDVRVEVDVSSLNSGSAALDQELRSENFFDSLNHPRIGFRATEIEMDAWGHAEVTGEIEIKGRKGILVLDAQLNNAGLNPQTNMYTLGVSLTGSLSRTAWGMDQLVPRVGDEIQIRIEAEFVQPTRAR